MGDKNELKWLKDLTSSELDAYIVSDHATIDGVRYARKLLRKAAKS